jgi:hypothetical protein
MFLASRKFQLAIVGSVIGLALPFDMPHFLLRLKLNYNKFTTDSKSEL